MSASLRLLITDYQNRDRFRWRLENLVQLAKPILKVVEAVEVPLKFVRNVEGQSATRTKTANEQNSVSTFN